MRKLLLLFSSTFIILNSTLAQAPLVKQWDYRFGGTGTEQISCFQQTTDGGYILAGFSTSGISGDKTETTWGNFDYWIVKIDSLGNKQWDKDFGGTVDDYLSSLQQTNDGGYILGGYSLSAISGDKTQAGWGEFDYWIVKTDSLGNKEWDKDFGGTENDYLNSIQQTTDGGYIFGGLSESGISGDKTQASWGGYDYWIVKIDSLGNKQWDKDFGGTDNDQLSSIQQTADGGYILGGYSYSIISGDKTQANWGPNDYWIVKTDSLGNKQWDKDFGGTGDDIFSSIQQTADCGYILGGFSASGISGDKTQALWGSRDCWIIKTDSLGNKQWDKDFGGADFEEFYSIRQTGDGGYLISGDSYSPISGDKTESNLGQEQTWDVKTDSLGNKQWDKTIFTSGHDEIGMAIQTKDGCYAMANCSDGGIAGYKTQASQGGLDYWLIKFCDTTQCNLSSPPIAQTQDTLSVPQTYTTYQWYHDSILIIGATNYFYVAPASGNYNIIVTDSNGCSVGAGIINVVAGVAEGSGSSSGSVQVYPNPNDGSFEIKYYGEKNTVVTIEIINTLGEIVYKQEHQMKQGMNSLSFGENWRGAAGVYFFSIRSDDGVVARGKMMVRE